jgi:hypothetical protein
MDGLEWKIRSRHFNGWCRGTAFQETSIYSVDFCGMFWIKRGLQWTPTRWQWSWRTWSTVDGCEILHQLVTMKGNYMNHYKWWDFNGITGITDLPTGDSDFANHPGFFGRDFLVPYFETNQLLAHGGSWGFNKEGDSFLEFNQQKLRDDQ